MYTPSLYLEPRDLRHESVNVYLLLYYLLDLNLIGKYIKYCFPLHLSNDIEVPTYRTWPLSGLMINIAHFISAFFCIGVSGKTRRYDTTVKGYF